MPDIKTAMSAALLRAPSPVQHIVQKTLAEWDDEGAGAPVVATEPKGTFMPSAKPASKRGGVIRNNVMRETFNFIVQNPGLTCKTISLSMERKGFKPGSVTSVVNQLWRSNQLIKDGNNSYRAKSSEYSPMGESHASKINKLKKRVETLKEVAKSKGIKDIAVQEDVQALQGIASLAAPPAQDTLPPLDSNARLQPFVKATDILKHMTVYQARALYNELKSMFGG